MKNSSRIRLVVSIEKQPFLKGLKPFSFTQGKQSINSRSKPLDSLKEIHKRMYL